MAQHRALIGSAGGVARAVDLFSGGGGASTGLEAALGRPVDIAVNHDLEALSMHAINHPRTRHLLESVWAVDPRAVVKNSPLGVLWLSPDCKHFSRAKGGTPVSKEIRSLAWVGLRWIALCKPELCALENVPEFIDWGGLITDPDGSLRPDPKRKGKTFESFVRQIRQHGYNVEWRELRACDQGAPTIRKRLFLIARRDGLPIVWPDATHGDPTSADVLAGNLKPWRSAAECIDFSIQSQSIFERSRPLVKNTMRRVAKGLWRHVFASPNPYIVSSGQDPSKTSSPSGNTIPDGDVAAVELTLAEASNEPCLDVGAAGPQVSAPVIAPLRGTSETHLHGNEVQAPLSTISAGGTHHGLASATLVPILNRETAFAAHVTHLTHHGDRSGHSVRDPLRTITGANRGEMAMVSASFVEQAYGGYNEDNDGRSVRAPMSTILSKGANQRLVSGLLIKYYSNGGQWQGLGDPMHTMPTKGRMGLVEAVQVPADCIAPELQERARQCAAFMHEHLPEHFPEPVDMVIFGDWVLVDVTLRMLKAPELFRAQGFPSSYVIDSVPSPELLFKDGVQAADPHAIPRVPLSATAQVRMCGNSVAPVMAEALIRANFSVDRGVEMRMAA
ncbi:DNA cytosine methyltransferase [Variovorax sp. LT1P1]|uniref:DNA cytosine methyltransferase n=1 Tax=Variovorax sp. LT1P1 TaxID=3443730 RepID=UPI003F48CBF3